LSAHKKFIDNRFCAPLVFLRSDLSEMSNLQKAFFVLAALAFGWNGSYAAAQEVVRVAVLADKGLDAAEEEWAHVIDWLNRSVAGHRFALVGLDHPGMRTAVHQGSVDFVITNAGNYSELEYAAGISRIATRDSPQALSPTQAVGSAIVVRASSDIVELADLKGKHLIAASHDAFCCYQIAARELILAGIDPEKDLGRLEFTGFPIQSIIRRVAAGEADAGIVRTCLLEQMVAQAALAPGALRVLAPRTIPGYPCQTTSRLYPDWAFAALRHTPAELSRRVAIALLEMPPAPDGYRWAIPAHYDVVDELFRDLKLGRYANLQEEALAALASRYRYMLLAAFALFVLWVVHTIRVDYLVARRTRELQRADAEKQQMMQAMRERQQALEHAGRLAVLGGMASAIAHELKQPLAAIENFARGIERRIASGRLDAAPLQNGCNEIVQQSQRANAIIARIIGFARKGAGERQPVALDALIKEAVDLFSLTHPQAHLTWRAAAAASGGTVQADPLQIQQVTFNLLKNAFDAQCARGRPDAEIRIDLAPAQRGWRVMICDQGGPLPEERRARLFEPFFTTKRDGLGLGLALSKWIIEAHGGTLTLTPGERGVCASFWLPEEHADE